MKKKLELQNNFSLFGQVRNKLTDSRLLSILERGCEELRVLDLSAATHNLTSYALDIIGKCNLHFLLGNIKLCYRV